MAEIALGNAEHVVYRRYHVAVRDADPGPGGGASVRIEVEARQCPADAQVIRRAVLGDCTEITNVFPPLQRDLDALEMRILNAVREQGKRTASAAMSEVRP
jgi:hypothetical protein